MFFKKSVSLFFLALAVMKLLWFRFLIGFVLSSPVFQSSITKAQFLRSFMFLLTWSLHKDSAFARKILFGNIVSSEDRISMKVSKSSFLKLGHILEAATQQHKIYFQEHCLRFRISLSLIILHIFLKSRVLHLFSFMSENNSCSGVAL